MATKFVLTRDINGYNGFGVVFSDQKYSTTLSTGVAQSLTIPSGMGMGANGIYTKPVYLAVFSFTPGANVFVANNLTAASPGGSFAASNAELNPAARQVLGGDVLSFITPDTSAYVTVSLYVIS